MSESVLFGVRVDRKANRHDVEVWHRGAGETEARDMATIHCTELWTGLQMAVAYMMGAAGPDPVEDLLRSVGLSE